jgi:uncharacterized SAM-binding protein YcdF (DUF218 family)
VTFVLKKAVGALLMPLPVIVLLGAVGWVTWARGRHRRLGRLLSAVALVLLWGLSCDPVAQRLVKPSERAYSAFPGDSVGLVVVLGSGHVSDPALPVSARLNGEGLYRLVEGLRIARAEPWTTVVFSGYGGADPRPNALVYRDLALALGLDSARIRVEPRPRDTRQEAELLAPLLRGHAFALVTSAAHMPRAMTLFRAQGLAPVPAPTGHLVKEGGGGFDWGSLLPDPGALEIARTAWYEWLGRAWTRLTGG